jgi:hypothetical protein
MLVPSSFPVTLALRASHYGCALINYNCDGNYEITGHLAGPLQTLSSLTKRQLVFPDVEEFDVAWLPCLALRYLSIGFTNDVKASFTNDEGLTDESSAACLSQLSMLEELNLIRLGSDPRWVGPQCSSTSRLRTLSFSPPEY